MFAIGLLLICILLASVGQIALKKGMSQLDHIESISVLSNPATAIAVFENFYIICGILIYIIAAFLWLGALSTLDVSFMYPMLSLAYLITAVFALVFLGENITFIRWAGILLVTVGCILIAESAVSIK